MAKRITKLPIHDVNFGQEQLTTIAEKRKKLRIKETDIDKKSEQYKNYLIAKQFR